MPNLLASEPSAYLKSAAHQPVHWHPWGEPAFARARAEDKPILLDIGAVWCHWCHVMDGESYEDPGVAETLNRDFVCIKVDRDERPDVDTRYQRAVQALTGQGGWPLTAFLTPEGEVVFGGTYFPPEENHYGRPGFRSVLSQVAGIYRQQRDKVTENAKAIRRHVVASLDEAKSGEVAPATLERAASEMARLFDIRYGGFGTAPKFPHPAAVQLLLARWHDTRENLKREVVEKTLTGMANGGIRDHVGGGFHRYAVDERWIVPHFEKMAYDNSELLHVYLDGYAALGHPLFKEVAQGIVSWVLEVLSDRGKGAFFTSQDADGQFGDDGDYWTWTLDELREALPEKAFHVARGTFDVEEAGEMHHNPRKNVLWWKRDPAGDDEWPVLKDALGRLKTARDKRTAPYVDALGERCRRTRPGPALGGHGRQRLAPPARSPARDVRRCRVATRLVRRDARARHRLGPEPRHARRGVGRQGSGASVRDASPCPPGLPAPQGGRPQDRAAAGRDRVRRHDLLAARDDSRGARGPVAVRRRVLGRTGLAVSPIGFGAWAIGGNRFGNSYGPTDDAESLRAVRRAYDLGCNFFDTADVYGHGHSEQLLGEALAGIRQRVLVATKVGGNFYNRAVNPLLLGRIAEAVGRPVGELAPDVPLPVTHDADFSPEYVRFAVEQSLRRLATDYLDLLQLHNPALSLIADPDTYLVLEDLKREGKIRFYGVSVHPPEEGLAAVEVTRPDTVQIVYNRGRREAEDRFFPLARASNVGVIAREPLANGLLAGKYGRDSTWDKGDIRARMPRPYVAQLTAVAERVKDLAGQAGVTPAQLALRFVLDNEAVSVVIVGMKTLAQVEENLSLE